ncbi:MAG: hypothetical protein GX256_06055 [Fretibacterium sp.]|nr:hypothetical protein [Fretibacterium sp.]
MTHCVDVLVPGPWWNALTYASKRPLPVGARVRVPLGRGERLGFVAENVSSSSAPHPLREVGELLDEGNVLGEELWDLVRWMGRNFLCGRGLALQALCPKPLLRGEPVESKEGSFLSEGALEKGDAFSERTFFSPWDEDRRDFYQTQALREGRSLLLFPESALARSFFNALPADLKSQAVLWPSTGGKKLWEVWQRTRKGDFRVVVSPPGGVFAPAFFDRIIVEDEANPGYLPQRAPRISARTLAGRRAMVLGAELILGGRMPSAKTFLRSAFTSPRDSPERSSLIFVDMRRSVKPEFPGIEGELPLTISLLERTRATLKAGREVFWILDRRGEAGEVACADCGQSLLCPRCGSILRSENKGSGLRCVRCGSRHSLPSLCPSCRGAFLVGRRPGLEALASAAGRFLRGYSVRLSSEEGKINPFHKAKNSKESFLILGTRRLLALCDVQDVGLVAWLDLDAELRRLEHGARFQVFSMVWESYWRGRKKGSAEERSVLIQTRWMAGCWQNIFQQGWERFWRDELRMRKSLNIPPFAHWVQIDLAKDEEREALLDCLEHAGLFVMDPGPGGPLWLTLEPKNVALLRSLLEPRFQIKCSRLGFPVITLWTE